MATAAGAAISEKLLTEDSVRVKMVVSGGTASIVVDSDSLVDSQLSQINEIVYEYTGILPENIKIIHK